MRRIAVPTLLLLTTLAAVAPVVAQSEPAAQETVLIDIQVPETTYIIETGDLLVIPVTLNDRSTDSVGGLTGSAGGGAGIPHRTSWRIDYHTDNIGWSIAAPSTVQTFGGDSRNLQLIVQLTPQARTESLDFDLVAQVQPNGGREPFEINITMRVISPGLLTFSSGVSVVPQLEPRVIENVPLKIRNLGVFYRYYTVEVTRNDCDMAVAAPDRVFLRAKEEQTFIVSLEGPDDNFWYRSEACIVVLTVGIEERQGFDQQVFIVTQVNGFSVFFEHYATAVILLALLLLLLLLIKRRKEKIEEEILGKPQKPWTIPAEQLYLTKLKEADERAWYVVRHYLMEDEYRSALLWYKSYKAATKGARAKERLIVREERRHERWQDRWAKRVMKPSRQAERSEERLQAKIDRKARKRHRKAVKKWEKGNEKLEAAHAKAVEKAEERWARDAKKAQKKGLAEPPRPDVEEPDYEDEPELELIQLEDHKWQAKADKYNARMERKEARLVARFERKNARRLRKVRRKVRKLGRKLDDDAFIDEHPLLREAADTA